MINLDHNENAFPASPDVIEAIKKKANSPQFYPRNAASLLEKLSTFLKIDVNQIMVGNGSDSLLGLIAYTFLHTSTRAIVSEYCYATIPFLISHTGAEIFFAPAKDFGHDCSALLKGVNEKTHIIFIVNPNNPTGTYLTHTQLRQFFHQLPPSILVILDEAYYEFMEAVDYPDSIYLLKEFPNLIITRTFSKAYGLAGLRIGYVVSTPKIIHQLKQRNLPFAVNSIGLAAAEASLKDQTHLCNILKLNKKSLLQLTDCFDSLGLEYLIPRGNYVTVNLKENVKKISIKLQNAGIRILSLSGYNLPQFVRISAGTDEQNKLLIQSLQTALKDIAIYTA